MHRRLALFAAAAAVLTLTGAASAQRATGIDVSAWQGTINWTSVANSGVDFTFIRSSRGGTTGTYNQSTQVGTLSHRYDDPYFVSNITQATSKGILAGAYHYTRLDRIVASDPSDPTYTGNTGLDEANHFLQQAGNYMRPGYIRPVIDVEGTNTSTKTVVTNFVLEFSDRIFAVTGIRPIIYTGTSYATDEVDSRLNTHDLWLARYSTAVDPLTAIDPPGTGTYPNVYGVWNPTYPTMPAVRPWDFWQYSSTGTTPGISGNVDQDVANGGIEFVKDFLVPALWMTDTDGEWTTAAKWNGVTYLPAAKDRVIISRPAGTYTVTLSSGNQAVRSLQLDEKLIVNGGALAVEQYVNSTQAASTITVNNGTITSASFANLGAYTQTGGTFTTGAVTNTTNNGSLTITGGNFHATSIRQTSLAVSGGTIELLGTGTSVVNTLTASGTGALDIGSTKFIIDYAIFTPIAALRAALANGNLTATSGGTGVGVAYFTTNDFFGASTGVFGGQTVDVSSILLARGLRGDTNLNGVVDFTDLVSLAQTYGTAGNWRQGDFNYDGVVNFADLVSLAQNYNATLLDSGAIAAGDVSGFGADWALAQSLAPEPATLVALALPSLVLRRRHRRHCR
jgi:GH25 family lysozyme M1 (1,4-beta-N-acetylmuramidase)